MKLFEPYELDSIHLKNRLVVPPMCMYQVKNHDGIATDFHYTHYTNLAIGQAGLIIVEATGVLPEGRITDNCLGLYRDEQISPLKRIVDSVHQYGSSIAIQLNHAGRKSEAVDHIDACVAPSAIAFNDRYRMPHALSEPEIQEIISAFASAAKRAEEAGFDGIEIHGAHGYLINQFISPVTNKRNDVYKDHGLFLRQVVEATAKAVSIPVWLRLSSTDYEPQGYTVKDMINILTPLKNTLACLHVSSGGVTLTPPTSIYPGYQIGDALILREKLRLPVIGVGLLDSPDLVNYLLESNQVDLVAIGRGLLHDPFWLMNVAKARKKEDLIFPSYLRGFK